MPEFEMVSECRNRKYKHIGKCGTNTSEKLTPKHVSLNGCHVVSNKNVSNKGTSFEPNVPVYEECNNNVFISDIPNPSKIKNTKGLLEKLGLQDSLEGNKKIKLIVSSEQKIVHVGKFCKMLKKAEYEFEELSIKGTGLNGTYKVEKGLNLEKYVGDAIKKCESKEVLEKSLRVKKGVVLAAVVCLIVAILAAVVLLPITTLGMLMAFGSSNWFVGLGAVCFVIGLGYCVGYSLLGVVEAVRCRNKAQAKVNEINMLVMNGREAASKMNYDKKKSISLLTLIPQLLQKAVSGRAEPSKQKKGVC